MTRQHFIPLAMTLTFWAHLTDLAMAVVNDDLEEYAMEQFQNSLLRSLSENVCFSATASLQ